MSDLPENTARVKVLHDNISVRVDPDEAPDKVEVREISHTTSDSVWAEFTEGDEMPVGIAEECWSAFNDRLAAFDEDGERLDAPSTTEKAGFDTALFHHR